MGQNFSIIIGTSLIVTSDIMTVWLWRVAGAHNSVNRQANLHFTFVEMVR